jgi:chemotaxis protein histidine kinase CheA
MPEIQLLSIPEPTPNSEIDEEIIEIFIEEVDEILEEIVTHLNAWKNNSEDSDSLITLRRAFHTLKGSGRLVGATAIGELGWCFENMLNQAMIGTRSVHDDMLTILEQVEQVLPKLIEQFKHHQSPDYQALLLMTQANYLAQNHEHRLDGLTVVVGTEQSDSSPESKTPPKANETVIKPEPVEPEKADETQALSDDKPPKSSNIENQEQDGNDLSISESQTIEKPLTEEYPEKPDNELELTTDAFPDLPAPDIDLPTLSEQPDSSPELNLDELPDLPNGEPELNTENLEDSLDSELEREGDTLPDEYESETQEPPEEPPKPSTNQAPVAERPEATNEVMPIFIDEADEILEKTQSLLERWQTAPNNMQLIKELQRELHTLKGGSRMVGIVPMGDLSHHLESVLTRIVEGVDQSNSQLQEIIQNSVDELAAMLEAVRSGVPLEMPDDLIRQINSALNGEQETEEPPVVKKSATPKSTSNEKNAPNIDKQPTDQERETTRIRVPASLIDKLTNLAGELSISKAQMEQQQGIIKNHLAEMEQTVIRLRDQLRRLEIETEAQIISHLSGTKELNENEEFDRLELDRFSTLQQLSRSLMESVNDLCNIQQDLTNHTRQSESLLIQQSRLGAKLQENIMRTRMTPFARITSRLERTARQTAKELDKSIDFVINGKNTEFEITVLSRIKAPLEQLLKNAIQHGIEAKRAGKSSTGQITLDLFREGTELIMRFSDDGRGLDLSAIRQKAEQLGLIQPNTVIDENELIPFILESNLSTTKTVTQASRKIETPEATDEIMPIFLDEADEILEKTQSLLERWQNAPKDMQLIKELQRELHTLKGGSRMAGLVPIGDLSHHLESVLTRIVGGIAESNSQLPEMIQNSVDELAAMLEAVRSGVPVGNA